MSDADVVVVGGGHNGLVCAAYLAKAGQRTIVVEARHQVGGCAGSDDALGARVNICNCDHSMVRSNPLIGELDLAAHGLEYIDLDPGQVHLGWDSPGGIPFFRDVDRTLEAMAIHHPESVPQYQAYLVDALPAARLASRLSAELPSARGLLSKVVGRNTPAALTVLRWSKKSFAQVMRQYFTSEHLLGPAMVAGPAVWGLSPDTPGSGLGALTLAMKHLGSVGRPVGGSGRLTDALASAIQSTGGDVRVSSPVASILCEGDKVRGVELVGGEVVEAPTVVVACDPREAIVRYLTGAPTSARSFVQKWTDRQPQEGYESKIDARLSGLPTWKYFDADSYASVGFTDPHSPTTMIGPTLADIDRGFRLLARGEVLDRPMFLINMPSVLDRSLVPGDDHVLSLEVLFTPYSRPGGWQGSPEPERWIDVASTLFEPGFSSLIDDWRAVTPDRYERDFHLPKGHATSFAGGPLAALLGREKELTRYTSPIPGLYLTGAATFPGAGVWGASGRNCAAVILKNS